MQLHSPRLRLTPVAYGGKPCGERWTHHEQLRHDVTIGIAVGKLESEHPRCAPLAGKNTLNRLEQAMHVAGDLSEQRYGLRSQLK